MKHFRQTANRTRLLAAPVLPVDLLAYMHAVGAGIVLRLVTVINRS